MTERNEMLGHRQEDPLDFTELLGFGFDLPGIADPDLWKYDRLKTRLTELESTAGAAR